MTAQPGGPVSKRGRIRLRADTDFSRKSNDGKYPWDRNWKDPGILKLPAGTEVSWFCEEYLLETVHTVQHVDAEGEVWYASKHTRR